jgi:hypothetical protein
VAQETTERSAPGIVRARLFDMGPYPAALKGMRGCSARFGNSSQEDLPETQKVLDQIEGFRPGASNNEYLRHEVDAYIALQPKMSNSQVSCWMYLAPDEYRLVGKREIVPFCNLSECFSKCKAKLGQRKSSILA